MDSDLVDHLRSGGSPWGDLYKSIMDQVRLGHKDTWSMESVDQIHSGHPNPPKIISRYDKRSFETNVQLFLTSDKQNIFFRWSAYLWSQIWFTTILTSWSRLHVCSKSYYNEWRDFGEWHRPKKRKIFIISYVTLLTR